jgi:serine/threonine-protein phosphatase 5
MKNLVACDVLWSDPVNDPGIRVNEARGCGTVFGPDVTAEFLSANGLRLIVRSHEGPDARDKRVEGDKMPSVDSGYAEDHVTDSE